MDWVFTRTRAILAVSLVTWAISGAVWAEQFERFGPYVAHYNTFNTTMLSADVARAYDITRSGNLALINIALLRVEDEGMDQPMHATVTVDAANLAGQRKNVEMVEVEDRGAIYYIGTFRIRDEERINFNISIQPTDDPRRIHRFSFNQMFYGDD